MITNTHAADLDLGVIGNCSYGALIDRQGRLVWCCLPRFDGDPVFYHLLDGSDADGDGQFVFLLDGCVGSEQAYETNTAVLRTRLFDSSGNAIEITDFAPRFHIRGRGFRPVTLVRRCRPLAGTPRVRILLRPRYDYGRSRPSITHGSNHIRYVGPEFTLRATTNAPVAYILDETPFLLDRSISFILGPDETLDGGVEDTARSFEERTIEYWQLWTRRLALPFEWQDAVIRAAITLKLCQFEETGAIIAAMTTSIPEAADTKRNWDYRYCWLRDAFFVVRALNSLAEVETLEHYLRYLYNVIAASKQQGYPANTNVPPTLGVGAEGHLQPVFGIGLEHDLAEQCLPHLRGYRGMGPVRAGNQAFEHLQHDVYGNAVLAAAQAFFDRRLLRRPALAEFQRLEALGDRAFALHDKPDAGMWELRTISQVHTSSSLMCWACCDRLARVALVLELPERAVKWRAYADQIAATITQSAWHSKLNTFAASFGGDQADAGLLLMAEVGFLDPDDPRFTATLSHVERELRRGAHMFRYVNDDDFGAPKTAFNICTFWYIDALARCGRSAEARELFESMLASRNSFGLLSEDIEPRSGELWGNYPQTYSLVGIINAATKLSIGWEKTV